MRHSIFWLGTFILILSSCDRNPHCLYEIDLPVTFVNKADTISIGDTLYFESKFSNLVPERNHVDFLELDNIDFKSVFSMIDINSESADHSGSQFSVEFEKGNLINYFVASTNDGAWSFDYEYSLDRYDLKLKITPNSPGNFSIVFSSLFHIDDDNFESRPNDCRSEQMRVFYKMNSGDPHENNYDLMQYAQDPVFAKLAEEDFLKGGYYAFVVKE